ncbi:hypothetical protein [Butyrivibrio sp. AE2015]|uniref:hypothetical protein n=1 Tax=Butyrivibrio sp. AE2015 TaxID=1280663 RepID=UPI0003B68D33|nr:hypothetical protein [Butyrivibrio sp. AE2015]
MEKISDFFEKNSGIILKCLIASFVILAICSKSSFLYPLNDWGDVSCYYIEGEGILHGLVPYRDLAEQKGPVIFFVYALALALNDRTFFGVFIVELISATIYLYFSLKTLGILCDVEKKKLV